MPSHSTGPAPQESDALVLIAVSPAVFTRPAMSQEKSPMERRTASETFARVPPQSVACALMTAFTVVRATEFVALI